MAIDVPTTLLLTLGVAVIAAGYLAFEQRTMKEPGCAAWIAGFCAVAVGCAISPLRARFFFLGVWVPDGLLIVAHLFFLFGVARFTGARITPLWAAVILPWLMLPALPGRVDITHVYAMMNAGLIAVVALRSAILLLTRETEGAFSARRCLGAVFLMHGLFYALKAAFVPRHGAFVDILDYQGYLIHISIFEGLMAEVTFTLLMAAAMRQRFEATIAALADRDPLTGVYNRRAFEIRATRMMKDAAERRAPGTLMLLDLDHFKRINDTFGHGIGDRLLVAFSERASSFLPRGGLLARIGGEEFAILLDEGRPDAIRTLGASICATFAADSADFEGHPVAATVSIGAVVLQEGVELPAALDAADAALYEAKRRGRNQLCMRRLSAGGVAHDLGGSAVPAGVVPLAARRLA